jgi:hypothetical protein
MAGPKRPCAEDRVSDFRELQRTRYLMTAARLAVDLAKERGCAVRELFGASVVFKNDSDDEKRHKERARFRDELTALRAFVRAVVELDGANGQMCDLGRTFLGDGASRCHGKATVRIAGRADRSGRSFDDSRNARLVDDFVDVGVRLHDLPPTQLRLLVAYYVFGFTAEELAQDLGCCPSSIGGRLTQSRRAMREALRPLLPQRTGRGAEHAAMVTDDLTTRRLKVSRFLCRRMEQPTHVEVCS